MVQAERSTELTQRIRDGAGTIHRNLSTPVLYEHAVRAGEGRLLQGGSFAVRTGARTGRSPKDKYIVRTSETSERVWWGEHNQPMDPDTFQHLKERCLEHLSGRELYVQDCTVSRDPSQRRSVRVVSEQAYPSASPWARGATCRYRIGRPLTIDDALADSRIDAPYAPVTAEANMHSKSLAPATERIHPASDGQMEGPHKKTRSKSAATADS